MNKIISLNLNEIDCVSGGKKGAQSKPVQSGIWKSSVNYCKNNLSAVIGALLFVAIPLAWGFYKGKKNYDSDPNYGIDEEICREFFNGMICALSIEFLIAGSAGLALMFQKWTG
jgi:hypothetical protein